MGIKQKMMSPRSKPQVNIPPQPMFNDETLETVGIDEEFQENQDDITVDTHWDPNVKIEDFNANTRDPDMEGQAYGFQGYPPMLQTHHAGPQIQYVTDASDNRVTKQIKELRAKNSESWSNLGMRSAERKRGTTSGSLAGYSPEGIVLKQDNSPEDSPEINQQNRQYEPTQEYARRPPPQLLYTADQIQQRMSYMAVKEEQDDPP